MCKRNGESLDHLFLHCPFAMNRVYDFGSIWSILGYAVHGFGAVRVLAR